MKKAIAFLLVSFFSLCAQGFDRNSLINPYKTVSLSQNNLLNPSRFSLAQSYSMSYSSGTSGSSWDGLYLSTLTYRFAAPVSMSLDVGMAHQPGALFKAGPMDPQAKNSQLVIPRFQLNYEPFKNTLLRFQYFNSEGLSANSPYYNRFDSDNLLLTPQRN